MNVLVDVEAEVEEVVDHLVHEMVLLRAGALSVHCLIDDFCK